MAATSEIPVKTAASAKERARAQGNASAKGSETRVSGVPEPPLAMPHGATRVTHDDIAIRAYYCWQQRGCPEGSAEVDWKRAEDELQARKEPV
jgi:hypothetical protein